MATKFNARGAVRRRTALRDEFWADVPRWTGPAEVGYFCAPRTLPLILQALKDKRVSGSKDPGPVYIDLLAAHRGEGVVELSHSEEHAAAAGYSGPKSWRERMAILQEVGFIKVLTTPQGAYSKVLLVHPAVAMEGLWSHGRISEGIWQAYRTRAIEALEPSPDEIRARDRTAPEVSLPVEG
ncbi:MAG: hypothetical protein R3B35_14010 [Gemmatimonadales bacterium]